MGTTGFLAPIAAAVAASIGVPASSVLVTIASGTTLTVAVTPPSDASGQSGALTGGAIAPPEISVSQITAAVNSDTFSASLAESFVEVGLPRVSAAELTVSAALVETTVVEAPSPPPPTLPPRPPPPLYPANQLLSVPTGTDTSSLSSAGGAGGGSAGVGPSSDDEGYILALVFASIAGVLFLIVLPAVCCVIGCWLRAQYVKRKRFDAKVLTGVVTDSRSRTDMDMEMADESAAQFDAAQIPAVQGDSGGGAMTRGLSMGTLVTRAPAPTGLAGSASGSLETGATNEGPTGAALTPHPPVAPSGGSPRRPMMTL